MAKKQKLKEKIKNHFKNLYFLKSEESEGILERLDKMPEKGLVEMLNVLDEAKKKQDETFKKLNEANPNFTDDLKKFANQEYEKVTVEITKKEGEDAEKLLDDL